MKTFLSLLLGGSLLAGIAGAEDIHLIQTALQDVPPTNKANSSEIFVLLLPNNGALVFREVGSKEMENAITHLRQTLTNLAGTGLTVEATIRPGSVVRYVPAPAMSPVARERLKAFQGFCEKSGLTFTDAKQPDTTASTNAAEVHLQQTFIQHNIPNVDLLADGSQAFVLMLPKHQVLVFQKFDSKPMQNAIADAVKNGVLHPGSTLRFSPEIYAQRIPPEQVEQFKAFCEKLGLVVLVSKMA